MGQTVAQCLSEFLKNEFNRRCGRNSRYSLRAYARDLKVESSALGRLMTGRRKPTRKTLEHLAPLLGLSAEEKALCEREMYTSPGKIAVPSYRKIEPALFRRAPHWYHYAILELTHTHGFRSEPQWIARRLVLPVKKVRAAVKELRDIGFLSDDWKDLSGNVGLAQPDYTEKSLMDFQAEILRLAQQAIYCVPIEFRDQTSMTMAVDKSQLPVAKEIIRRFRRRLCEVLKGGKSSRRDSVYHLSVSLYPVTQLFEEES